MVPHAYSVTINWAPPVAFPSFDFGPAFLLRETLETCDSYDKAVRSLTEMHLSTSVFFTVCGVDKDQACVIERTQRDSEIRPLAGPVLVQANHHVARRFGKNNEDLREVEEGEEVSSLEGSGQRAEILTKALTEVPSASTLEYAAQALDIPTVLNTFTCQQMVFCPRTGEVKVWRKADG
jgi:predicted choloylglycine hydrolase